MKVIIVIPSDVEKTKAFKSIKDAAKYINKTPQYLSSSLRNNPVFKSKEFIVIKHIL